MAKIVRLNLKLLIRLGVCMPKQNFEEMVALVRALAERDEQVIQFSNTPITITLTLQKMVVQFAADLATAYFFGDPDVIQREVREKKVLMSIWYPCLVQVMQDISPALIKQMIENVPCSVGAKIFLDFGVVPMYLKYRKTHRYTKKGINSIVCTLRNQICIDLSSVGVERYLCLDDQTLASSLLERAEKILTDTREQNKEYDLARRMQDAHISTQRGHIKHLNN